jgi:hypothetical protein
MGYLHGEESEGYDSSIPDPGYWKPQASYPHPVTGWKTDVETVRPMIERLIFERSVIGGGAILYRHVAKRVVSYSADRPAKPGDVVVISWEKLSYSLKSTSPDTLEGIRAEWLANMSEQIRALAAGLRDGAAVLAECEANAELDASARIEAYKSLRAEYVALSAQWKDLAERRALIRAEAMKSGVSASLPEVPSYREVSLAEDMRHQIAIFREGIPEKESLLSKAESDMGILVKDKEEASARRAKERADAIANGSCEVDIYLSNGGGGRYEGGLVVVRVEGNYPDTVYRNSPVNVKGLAAPGWRVTFQVRKDGAEIVSRTLYCALGKIEGIGYDTLRVRVTPMEGVEAHISVTAPARGGYSSPEYLAWADGEVGTPAYFAFCEAFGLKPEVIAPAKPVQVMAEVAKPVQAGSMAALLSKFAKKR